MKMMSTSPIISHQFALIESELKPLIVGEMLVQTITIGLNNKKYEVLQLVAKLRENRLDCVTDQVGRAWA